ncbi:hypothetical protein QA612_13135 [Evansella sp. AB-P1]|uniref:hypothetical protein n=1 Tax=Evansella sp. AB-P1 TaxID=3037653 RepID=UPI00241C6851|nr:hypothetical protein [Evansella sp. AB-P1]MDG5788427.1 hypothetical protein [Evansella sp. AB-P1]
MKRYDEYDKDAYFQLRDKMIRRLPEPERSVFQYFRKIERRNLADHGKLVINGKSPIQETAEYFMLDVSETKKICLRATNMIKDLLRN